MEFTTVFQMIFALAATLGLFGLAVWGLRKFGPTLVRRMQTVQGQRRMCVVETLILGPNQRLLMIRVDGAERLVLLGQGELDAPSPAPRKARP